MKKEINSLNLIYGATTIDIFSKYKEFKHLKKDEVKDISKKINDYFIWLENQKNINVFKVVKIGMFLLDNSTIRKYILNNNINILYDETIKLLNEIDYDVIEQERFSENNMYIEFSSKYENDDTEIDIIKFMKYQLENSNLFFKDLIMLLIDNYDFPKKLFKVTRSKNRHIDFLNRLNYIYYHLANYLNSSREDLYYCSLFLLKYPYIDDLLYTRSHYPYFETKNCNDETSSLIYTSIIKGLHYINSYYFIEFFDFNYRTTQKQAGSYRLSESKEDFIRSMTVTLTKDDKIFLYKIAYMEDDYKLTKAELKELEHLIASLKKLDNVTITSQELTLEKKELLKNTISYINEYADNNNIKLLEFIYDMQIKNDPSYLIAEFYIQHNNFKYRFIIRKLNDKLTWTLYLKHKRTYKINMYFSDDFKHIYQAMLED